MAPREKTPSREKSGQGSLSRGSCGSIWGCEWSRRSTWWCNYWEKISALNVALIRISFKSNLFLNIDRRMINRKSLKNESVKRIQRFGLCLFVIASYIWMEGYVVVVDGIRTCSNLVHELRQQSDERQTTRKDLNEAFVVIFLRNELLLKIIKKRSNHQRDIKRIYFTKKKFAPRGKRGRTNPLEWLLIGNRKFYRWYKIGAWSRVNSYFPNELNIQLPLQPLIFFLQQHEKQLKLH